MEIINIIGWIIAIIGLAFIFGIGFKCASDVDDYYNKKNCDGCKHDSKWEDEKELRYPSPCTDCCRRCCDRYEVD